jgi:hypothetical protein
MGVPVNQRCVPSRPRRAWWKLMFESLFVLYLVISNITLVLDNIEADPRVQALAWVKPVGLPLTALLAALWALFLLWIGKSIWRKLRDEYPRR